MTRRERTGTAEEWLLELAQRHRLSPTQRQIVQRMLGMFPEVAFLSTVEIAEQTGVSQPTVTRLATALGFAGFPEFRSALREAVLADRPAAPPARHTAVEQERANLQSLARTIDSDRLREAVRLLAGTPQLGVLGLRASAALAQYFGYFAQRLLPSVSVHTDAGTADDAVLQCRAQGATAILIFAMPRYPAATVAAIALARSLGLATVVVTDTALVPFEADALLVAPVGTGLTFDSHAAAVVLSVTLLDAIAATDPRRTQERLEAHEALVDRWAHG